MKKLVLSVVAIVTGAISPLFLGGDATGAVLLVFLGIVMAFQAYLDIGKEGADYEPEDL